MNRKIARTLAVSILTATLFEFVIKPYIQEILDNAD